MGQARRLAGVATVVVVAALAGATAASTSDVATLAFASTRGCSGNSGYGGVDPSDIYVVAADGSGLAQITHDCLSGDPVWSPDGARIAFVSSRDGMPAVYTMDAGGGDVRRVSQDGVVAWQPSWSRTGRLAYAVDFPAPQRGIWTIAPDGSGAAHITGFGERPSWSADGARIAFTDTAHPDGRSQPSIATMSADGSDLRRIGFGWGPAYAPDGRYVAWIAGDYPVQPGGRITLAATDGSGATNIAIPGLGFLDARLAWSPSSDELAYQSDVTNNDEIYVIPTIGGAATRVTVNAATDTDPDWRPAVPSSGLVVQRVAFKKGACALRPGTATVTVADAQGRPLAGASVVIAGARVPARASTSAAGTAAVRLIRPTRLRGRLSLVVKASLAGRPPATRKVSLPRC